MDSTQVVRMNGMANYTPIMVGIVGTLVRMERIVGNDGIVAGNNAMVRNPIRILVLLALMLGFLD